MKVIILAGSSRKNSHTLGLAQAINAEVKKQSQESELIDLVELNLPPANPEFHKNPEDHPDERVRKFSAQIDTADAFVLLSPVYHNSYSGTIKVALDSLAVRQFAGKTVALGSNGGNRTSQVVDHLRIVARALNTIAIPTQVCVDGEDFREENGFVLQNADMLERIERLVAELLDITRKLQSS